ncbi:hypothetical protein [Castellaniella sp. GW247-6E4]|uniref:polysaccharide deacetylase WbmS family protein n=1 Tax=Castellaniella sp. GW247-6E4 TaxID=3140380 RepID=UPI0033150BE6
MSSSTFGLIRDINPKNDESWRNRVFLTFDIDWAHDTVIEDTLALLEQYDVPVTWFATHRTEVLDRIRSNVKFDVGIHPNFNPLLEGSSGGASSAASVLQSTIDIAPQATAVRSHSLVHSERLASLFISHNLRYCCNAFIPLGGSNRIAPWELWGELVMVPHCWQDNVALMMNMRVPTPPDANDQLIVVNFHPIHVFLNTEDLGRYERTRPIHQKPLELIRQRFKGYGTRNRLIELLEVSKAP